MYNVQWVFFKVDQFCICQSPSRGKRRAGGSEGKVGPYLSNGATGTQAAGQGDHRGPGEDHLLEMTAEGTGPGGACEERPVRKGKRTEVPEPPEKGTGHSPWAFLPSGLPRII